jgi:asparagine synthase (glutamine-hydrolysing)
MPGICGIVGQPRENLAAELVAMAGRLKHHPWYGEERWTDPNGEAALGRVSLGFVDRAPQPAANEDRSLRAVLAGEIYDYAEQRRRLAGAGHHFAGDSHAELLLHGYEQNGKDFFRSVNGSFSAAVWNARNRQLLLVNDRFGIKPLYYAHLPGRLLFASEIKALLADPDVSRQPHLRGIAQFFTFGQLLGEDTFLEAVRVLPAAGWLTYDAQADRLDLDRYGRLEASSTPPGRTQAETLDRLDDAFVRAVDRRTRDTQRLGLSLSGGLDARTILGVVPPDRPLTTVCMGIPGSMDHQSAGQMARLAGCRHYSYTLQSDFLDNFERHLKYMVHLTDGHFLSQCIVMPTLPFYREVGIDVLLRGHAGEILHMDKAYNFSLDEGALALRDEAGLEAWLLDRLHAFVSHAGAGSLFAPELAKEAEGLARDSLRACLRESAGMGPPVQRVWHLFITQRLRREMALSMVKFGSVVETRLPYLDNDLVEAVLAVPPEQKLGDRIQAHMLRRHRPEFLRVVNTNTGTRMEAGRLARFVAKVRMKVLAKLGVRGYQPYERLGLWLRRQLRPFVEGLLLSERALSRGFFNPDTVRATVQDHTAGRRNHTMLLMALLIFELGQHEFMDGEASPAAACGLALSR